MPPGRSRPRGRFSPPTRRLRPIRQLASLYEAFGADNFNVVSIGFNQPFDSPQAMKIFATQYGIHLPNWEFLSPAPAIVDELTQNFGFSYVATAAGFDHTNQITLVDAEGRIFRQIYGETFTAADLAEPLKAMITGAPIPSQTGTLAELADRIRIVKADLLGDTTLPGIAVAHAELGVPMRVVYLSNAEAYFFYDDSFRASIAAMPADGRSFVLRTVNLPQFQGEDRSIWHYQIQPLEHFAAALGETGIDRAADLHSRATYTRRGGISLLGIDRPDLGLEPPDPPEER